MTDGWMTIKVELCRRSTGEVRTYDTEIRALKNGLPDPFIWENGNYACDCNRRDFFIQAGGEEAPDDSPCSRGQFSCRLLNVITGEVYYSESGE